MLSLDMLAAVDRRYLAVGAALSVVLFAATVFAVPMLVARLPRDYLNRPPARRSIFVHALRAVLGTLLVMAGIVMLFAPGPGIVAIVLGIMLVDFPGKRRFVRRFVARPRVLEALNALRVRRGREPLEPPRASLPPPPPPASTEAAAAPTPRVSEPSDVPRATVKGR
jgi:UPF0716 family protein affecting phage T7 exclusion